MLLKRILTKKIVNSYYFKNYTRLIALILLLILMASSLNISYCDDNKVIKKKVILQLRWENQFQFAGYYTALWNGYYSDEGIDVNIKSGFDDDGNVLLAPDEVNKGNADFGVGAVDILFAIDKGEELSIVSTIFQKSAVAYYMLDNTKFNSVYDFKKLHVARRKNDLLDIELKAMLLSEGFSFDTNELLPEKTILTFEDLLEKKYDVIPEYLGKVIYQARKKGYKVKEIKPIDYGIDFYGDSLFTSKQLAENDPDLVEKFRKATIKGWEYALKNPEEISRKIVEHFYSKDKDKRQQYEYNIFQAKEIQKLSLYPIVQTGNINVHRWNQMSLILNKLKLISSPIEVNNYIFDYRTMQEKKNIKIAKYYKDTTILLLIIFIILYILFVTRKNKNLKNEIIYRKSVEEKINLNNERYQLLFNSAFLGITLTDVAGNILSVNKKWIEMTGYSEYELIKSNIFDIIAKDNSKDNNVKFESLKNALVKSIEVERCYIRKDGKKFWGKLFMSSMVDPESKDQVFLGMILDITYKKLEKKAVKRAENRFRKIINDVALEIKDENLNNFFDNEYEIYDKKEKLSFKLENINIELERLFKKELDENKKKEIILLYQARLAAMGEMVANIAHQWRQPLNNLGIILSNLEDSFKYNELDKEEMDSYIKSSKTLIQKMSETIDVFRNFLKPKTIDKEFYVCSTISSVLLMLKNSLEFYNISLVLNCSEFISLTCDKNYFEQALFNLLNNSIDSLSDTNIDLKRIEIKVKEDGENIILTIEDNGVGIEKNCVNKIFEPYFSTKKTDKGTGLGLYIVKNIIEGQMKGEVNLLGYENGAKFSITIPK
ncbi:ABC transporter substrate-binding protein [Helicovermis profundi]|uniref:histidine kinase n=1 Tax=Helicovermis profundi TaxID=3065157 RepID=A0AAU9EDH2_9FIRM|nr:hypothetical protein HLPR_10130 [Clostridia bacterium S502]